MSDGRDKYFCGLCGTLLSRGEFCSRCYSEMDSDFSTFTTVLAEGSFEHYTEATSHGFYDGPKELNFDNPNYRF